MKPNNLGTFVTLRCEVLPEDYETMLYYYDSGMVDVTAKNPAALALQRSVKPGLSVRVRRESCEGRYSCIINGEKFQISDDLSVLIEKAECGIFLEKFRFKVTLPEDLVSR